MSLRGRLIASTAALLIALGLLSLRAWRNESSAPAPASGPFAAAVVTAPEPAALPPRAPDVAPPALLESPDARFRRRIAEMASEFERLRSLPDEIDRFRASAELENEYAHALEQNPALAAMLVREMPPGFADTHFGVLALSRWAATGRVAAAEWMAAHPAATLPAAEALARGWLAQDEGSLAAHLSTLPPTAWRGNLAHTAAEDAFLAKRPATVLALVALAAPGDSRGLRLVEWNATAWAIQDAEAAAAWASRELDSARRQTLLAAVAVGEANRDPEAAAARLFREVANETTRINAVQAIARLWTRRDAEAAARWAAGLPDGPLRESAEAGLLAIAVPEGGGS